MKIEKTISKKGEPVTSVTTTKAGLYASGVAGLGIIGLAGYGILDLAKKLFKDDDEED